MPAISILLPTYNAQRFLVKQVQSILDQQFDDFELLIIDDGSTDGTVAELKKWVDVDSRVRLLPSFGNQGQKCRLIQLIEASRGDLLAIADQDDVWHSEKLSILYRSIGSRGLVYGSSWVIDGNGIELGNTLLDFIKPLPEDDHRLIYLFKPAVSAHAVLARREIVSSMSLSRSQPFDWLQALDAAFGQGIAYIPEAITYHRLHDTNQSNGGMANVLSFIDKISRKELRRKWNARLFQQYELCQRLEYLAFSPLIDLSLRSVFEKALFLCQNNWFGFDRSNKMRNKNLQDELGFLLKPLAGSERDWNFTRKMLIGLSRSNINPYSLIRQYSTIIINPSL